MLLIRTARLERSGNRQGLQPEGLHVIVAELHESVIVAAGFQLNCDFGRGQILAAGG
ncbi:hypothetical protein [Streptomyces ardesiacus]|uniref:hypothetical protein n=1 Tax=Streptomyces ardesiacus TaxID=285564 RepID=UPI00201F8F73|nr:hypothetical protein [Streptomyces ardesiacus]MCL7370514.1 hypothetical protein [Streptomyces ardesiacus]